MTSNPDDDAPDLYGPQTQRVLDLLFRIQNLRPEEARALVAARKRVKKADWEAARRGIWPLIRHIPRYTDTLSARAYVLLSSPGEEGIPAAGPPASAALAALIFRDMIGDSFTQAHYDTYTAPWRRALSPVHPDDPPLVDGRRWVPRRRA